MKFNKYSLLAAPAALLMFMSAGGGALANVASAKSVHHARTSRPAKKSGSHFVVKFRKITPKKGNRKGARKNHKRKTQPVVEAVQNGKTVKAGKNGKKARTPWKASWANMMKVYNTQTLDRLFSSRAIAARKKYVTNGYNPRTGENYKNWNQFYQKHANSNSTLNNYAKTFPGFVRLEESTHNVNAQRLGHAWSLVLPNSYSKYHDSASLLNSTRNGELLGNHKLSRFTPYMLSQLNSYEIPAHNGQRILTSFSHMMKRSKNHPKLQLGNVTYVYNPVKGIFEQQNGSNNNGNTYKFNSKTNKYVKVNSKNVSKQLNDKAAKTQSAIDAISAKNAKDAANNSKFDQSTRNKLNAVMDNNTAAKANPNTSNALSAFLNGPEAGYKALANDNELSASQRAVAAKLADEASSQKLPNQIASQVRAMENGDKDVTFTMTLGQRFDIMSLYTKGAFNGLSQEDSIALARYLVQTPTAMDAYLAKYNVGPEAHAATDVTTTAKAANNKAANSQNKGNNAANVDAFITNNESLLRQHGISQAQALQLAKAYGLM